MEPLSISIVVPALNEALYLPPTLAALRRAFAALPPSLGVAPEFVVVDNASEDNTAQVARANGARVVSEKIRGIARARNAGARASSGDLLVFVDADTIVPLEFAAALVNSARDPTCLGGAFDTEQKPRRAVLRAYLGLWRNIGLRLGMAQGAAQFCRRGAFELLAGYDERLFMGEDVDFYWRLKRLARKQGQRVAFVQNVPVASSARRFDHWPLWKTLFWTNPIVAALFCRSKTAWRGWYAAPPR